MFLFADVTFPGLLIFQKSEKLEIQSQKIIKLIDCNCVDFEGHAFEAQHGKKTVSFEKEVKRNIHFKPNSCLRNFNCTMAILV